MIKSIFCFIALLVSLNATADPLSDESCLDCHGVSGFATPTGEHGNSPMRSLDINAKALNESVHGELGCVGCHEGIEELPHGRDDLQAVDCVTCHGRMKLDPVSDSWRQQKRTFSASKNRTIINSKLYTRSIHSDSSKANNATCDTCHTAHYVYRSDDPRSLTHNRNSPQLCGECHEKELKAYKISLHGANLMRPWLGDSATCGNCHNSHRITEGVANLRVVTEACGDCHKIEVNAYMNTAHGKLAWLGSGDAAKCSNCHETHATHKVADTASKVSSENRLETCRKCHEDATENFIEYRVHGNTHDYEQYPFMWVVAKFMVGIVILVLIFFYTHSMLWFYREAANRVVVWRTHNSSTYRVRVKKEKKPSEQHFRRFSWQWRMNHWFLATSVMTLVFTGMSVMYADGSWAVDAVAMVGGLETMNLIHRFAAVVFIGAVVGHAIAVIINIKRDPDFDWFGPDSLLPRKKDWRDMKGQIKWFFNRGEAPQFDRWTYWEKFDYWAVYWGAIVIGISGIMLWFSNTVGNILPGWVLNIATIAHGVEAFLAVATLFTVHFFNNHFRPSKFPLDTVMFTGSWDLEEFIEERPEQYRRLKESGELEQYLVKPPSKQAEIISHILGFTLLSIGLILLVLVVKGFIQGGLV
jgi:cytochrome b subunit of formate dehydrogenase